MCSRCGPMPVMVLRWMVTTMVMVPARLLGQCETRIPEVDRSAATELDLGMQLAAP